MNVFHAIFNDPIYDQTNNMVRWNGLSRIKDETVGHHTHIVTFFSRVIFEEIFKPTGIADIDYYRYSSMIMTYALFHDFDEAFTGDILHNFKHNDISGEELRKNIDEYLDHIRIKHFNLQNPFHNLIQKFAFEKDFDPFVKGIVKLADWLSMSFYIKKEIMLGNRNVEGQYEYCNEKCKTQAYSLIIMLQEEFPELTLNYEILSDILNTKFYE